VAGAAALVLVAAVGGGMWFKQQQDARFAQPAVTQMPVMDEETLAKIGRLLETAEAHFKGGRLVSPQGNNAYEAYQMVLSIDPNNSEALQGVSDVKNRFFKRAQLLDIEGQRDDVEKHLALAEQLFPTDDRVELLRSRLQSR